jgi:hypothetical protein
LKKQVALCLVLSLLFFLSVLSYGQRVYFKTEMQNKDRMRIFLYQEEKETPMGVYPVFYQLEEGKFLTVGYRIQQGENEKAFVDFDTRNAKEPLRIVLYGMGEGITPRFSDIEPVYEKEYIKHLYDAKIIEGKTPERFGPKDSVTRAEFMTMVCRALQIPPMDKDSVFGDILDHWGRGYILAGVEKGFIAGYEDQTIRPNDPIHLASASVILDKAFSLEAKRNASYQKLTPNQWYSHSVKKMLDAFILYEFESLYFENFSETKFLNRADISMMLSRAMTHRWNP